MPEHIRKIRHPARPFLELFEPPGTDYRWPRLIFLRLLGAYLPPLNPENPSLRDFLRSQGWLDRTRVSDAQSK